jgi:hypothetical protein
LETKAKETVAGDVLMSKNPTDWKRLARFFHSHGVELTPGQLQAIWHLDSDHLLRHLKDAGWSMDLSAGTDRDYLVFLARELNRKPG